MGFAVGKWFAEAVNVVLIIQNGLKTLQAILCENEEHITVGKIEMRAAVALADVALAGLAQNP